MSKYKRTEPYTERGIRRMTCFRCGRPARFQWQICSDGNQYRPLCTPCDVMLNALVLNWAGFPDADDKIKAYAKEKGITKAQLDEHTKRTARIQGAEATARLMGLLGLEEERGQSPLFPHPNQGHGKATEGKRSPTILTVEGKAKIEAEIRHLKTYSLPQAEEKVKWAREYGDGVDIHTTIAKRDFYKKRIPMLEDLVAKAVIIEQAAPRRDT